MIENNPDIDFVSQNNYVKASFWLIVTRSWNFCFDDRFYLILPESLFLENSSKISFCNDKNFVFLKTNYYVLFFIAKLLNDDKF